MLAFVLRRLAQSIVVMLAVALVAFALFNFVGDPVANMVGPDTPLNERAAIRERLGLDEPLPLRYARFVAHVAHGDFGVSYRTGEPAGRLILSRLPATLELALCSALLALIVGLPVGVYTGLHPKGAATRLMLTASLLGISLPTFVVGLLFIMLFSVTLHWLPAFGRGEVVQFGLWSTGLLTRSGLAALVLPSLTLGLFQTALIVRLVRSEILETLRTDYIKFARARGLSERVVHYRHALKSAIMPVITISGLQLGAVIAFAIITETVFSWPGMGLLFLQSVQTVDIPVMAAYLVLIGFLFVVINLVVDLLYFVVDPRLRLKSRAA
ncbi:MAG: ABC transporter permease [Rhodospirillaceae bacterium]|nr:ABC transporter permease [Rhodospirillaceae bacterium]